MDKVIQNGFFAGWMGLIPENSRQYLPKPISMEKVHLDQTRKIMRSKQLEHPEEATTNKDPVKETDNDTTQKFYATI